MNLIKYKIKSQKAIQKAQELATGIQYQAVEISYFLK